MSAGAVWGQSSYPDRKWKKHTLKITILLIVILAVGTLTANFGLQKVKASPATTKSTPVRTVSTNLVVHKGTVSTASTGSSIVNFTIMANVEAWNGTVTGCTSGTPSCNPTVLEFRGVTFIAKVQWGDCCTHDFAIYTGGFPAGSVSTTNTCSLSNTNGCLVASSPVFSSTTTISFTPTIPKDDFTGLGTYEYYCQYHPGPMHGKFTLYKSPDLDKSGVVSIVDVATVAFSFGATPTSSNWNAAADLDNNGVVNILDVAFDAFYFGDNI
jgi:dockerin type I repeat protein